MASARVRTKKVRRGGRKRRITTGVAGDRGTLGSEHGRDGHVEEQKLGRARLRYERLGQPTRAPHPLRPAPKHRPQREGDEQDDCDAPEDHAVVDRDQRTGEQQQIDRKEEQLKDEVPREHGGRYPKIAAGQARKDQVPVGARSDQEHDQPEPQVRSVTQEDQAQQVREDRGPQEVDPEAEPGEAEVAESGAQVSERHLHEHGPQHGHQGWNHQMDGVGGHPGKLTREEARRDGERDERGLARIPRRTHPGN